MSENCHLTLKTCATLLSIALCAIFAFPAYAASIISNDPKCRDAEFMAGPKLTHSRDGVPLSKVFRFRIADDLYDIPTGYWFSNDVLWFIDKHGKHRAETGYVDTRDGHGFRFWSDNLNYIARDFRSGTIWFLPCEPGVLRNHQERFLVGVVVQPQSHPNYRSMKLPVYDHAAGNVPSSARLEEKYGLLRYGLDVGGILNHTYSQMAGSPYELRFLCTADSHAKRNAGCTGTIIDRSKPVALQMSFASNGIAKWRDVVQGAFQLLEEWRVPPNDQTK